MVFDDVTYFCDNVVLILCIYLLALFNTLFFISISRFSYDIINYFYYKFI